MKPLFAWGLVLAAATSAQGSELDEVLARLGADTHSGKPLVAHVVVALCDNEFQGIVPVPASLGDGDAPKSNLYWGALYGVRGYFRKQPDWQPVSIEASRDPRVLDRVLYRRELVRDGRRVQVFLLADAWRGRNIADAIGYFLEINRGQHAERIRVGELDIEAGGSAHLVGFVGHNGLMDSPAPELPSISRMARPHASVVLACMSDSYFAELLRQDSLLLITTTGLMAPEAYTLDALVTTWFEGGDGAKVRQAAARAYAKYQRISENAARRLFVTHAVAAQP